MDSKITREFEDEGIRIYKRIGNPVQRGFMKKYFEFDIKRNESTGMQFDTSAQVVSYLKKGHRI